MLPYLHLEDISIGPLTLHVWGFVVGIAFVVSVLVAVKHARCTALNADHIWNMSLWIVLSAIVGARLFHVFAYEWAYYSQHLSEIPKMWNGGLASFGGYIGGTLAALAYFKKHRLPFLPWADLLAFVLPLGIGIGRIACYLVNMHPGIPTTSFLGVQYPDTIRFDLGFLLSLNGFLLFFIFLFLFYPRTRGPRVSQWVHSFSGPRYGVPPHIASCSTAGLSTGLHKTKPKPVGFYLTFFLLWYGITRFLLDFLRASDLPMSDMRYLALTPAQYGALGFICIGLSLVLKISNKSKVSAVST